MVTLSLKKFSQKSIKTMCLLIGGFYTVFGVLAILMVKLQVVMLSNFEFSPDEAFTNTLTILHQIWIIYMPLLIVLGLAYLVFGVLFNKIKANKYQINILLSILCLVWVLAYSVSCFNYLDVFFSGFTDDFEAFKYFGFAFAGFGFLAVFALMTIPQYIIGKRIKLQETYIV